MRSFIFSLLLYSNALFAYSEESYIDEIAFINAAIISIVPVINFIQLKMHYNLQYHGSVKRYYFNGFAATSVIASELCILMKEKISQPRDYKSRSLRPQVLKSSSAYGIILESKLLNKILLQDKEDLNCTLLLRDSIVYPVSIGGNLKLSIELKRKNSAYDLTHLESVYGKEDDSWFETLCISTEIKESGKEKKVVSVFNRAVLTNVCMELSDLDELPRPKNISEYHLSTLTGESVGKFLAINMDKNHSRVHQLNICNKQDGYFEFFNSHETSIESALQDYIINLHLQETHAGKKWTRGIYLMAVIFGSGVINYIASYLVDYASFYLLIGSCAICFNQVQYPGVQACAHHWFCVFCYERARLAHPRNCPLCGV